MRVFVNEPVATVNTAVVMWFCTVVVVTIAVVGIFLLFLLNGKGADAALVALGIYAAVLALVTAVSFPDSLPQAKLLLAVDALCAVLGIVIRVATDRKNLVAQLFVTVSAVGAVLAFLFI